MNKLKLKFNVTKDRIVTVYARGGMRRSEGTGKKMTQSLDLLSVFSGILQSVSFTGFPTHTYAAHPLKEHLAHLFFRIQATFGTFVSTNSKYTCDQIHGAFRQNNLN